MRIALCTLFNVNYLDKGLVLYESLEKVCPDFVLYVLAMDDRCYDILHDLNKKNISLIKISEFENEKLLTVRQNRTFGQYCYTCSSSLIKYIFDNYNETACAYIDADLCFYSDPTILFYEMIARNASVSVIGHRFGLHNKKREQIVGKYCVQFNIFANDSKGNLLLEIWINQCLISCECLEDGIHWGDQMYLHNWCDLYDFVIESEVYGAGVAPWNIEQYKRSDKGNTYIYHRGKDIPFVFYHFENIKYICPNYIDISAIVTWNVDVEFVRELYTAYLKEISKQKMIIKDCYDFEVYLKLHSEFPVSAKLGWFKKILRVLNPYNWKEIILLSIPGRLYRKYNFVSIAE